MARPTSCTAFPISPSPLRFRSHGPTARAGGGHNRSRLSADDRRELLGPKRIAAPGGTTSACACRRGATLAKRSSRPVFLFWAMAISSSGTASSAPSRLRSPAFGASARLRSISPGVAAGRYDGFWESGLSALDVSAGILLVREAGGFVTDFRGGAEPIERARGAGRQRRAPFQAAQAAGGPRCARIFALPCLYRVMRSRLSPPAPRC